MTEIDRLNSKFIQHTSVTPSRVQEYVGSRGDWQTRPEDIWAQLDGAVILQFVSNTGRLKEKKVKKFFKGLDNLLDEYKGIDLIKMDEDCINKDGSINEQKFKLILAESKSGTLPSKL